MRSDNTRFYTANKAYLDWCCYQHLANFDNHRSFQTGSTVPGDFVPCAALRLGLYQGRFARDWRLCVCLDLSHDSATQLYKALYGLGKLDTWCSPQPGRK